MAAKILQEFKQRIAGFELEPSNGGCFEITIDGQLVYSKLKTGELPSEAEMAKAVLNRLS